MDSLDNFRERLEAFEQQTKAMEAHTRTIERRRRLCHGMAGVLMVLSLVGLPVQSAYGQELEGRVSLLEAVVRALEFEIIELQRRIAALEALGNVNVRVEALENTLRPVTRVGDELMITGVNVRIVNGMGATQTTNELGNLIVGYNEAVIGPVDRTGSHNVVVGESLNFSSYGGLVVGQFNRISGPFAAVSGGQSNTASGDSSAVSGGQFNTARGILSAVSGGAFNTASEVFSAVSGGGNNTASGIGSAVSGGLENMASGFAASVSGGRFNMASGDSSAVSGGENGSVSGEADWRAGELFQDF